MKDWSIRYDVVRRMPNGSHESACIYGNELGFATVEEAGEVKKALDEASTEADVNMVFLVWPIAVNDYANSDDEMGPVAPARKLVTGSN